MDFSFLQKTQSRVVKVLQNGIKKNRTAQVYLFDGAKGTPKMQAAMYLASMLLCDNHNACGNCLNCKRLEEGVHPRLFIVEPTKGEGVGSLPSIKKEQISELEKEFNFSSIEKGPRIFIINDIDRATLSSANTLLKFLEEMKDDCYGILTTENLASVLSTIKSRSQVITFDKIDKNTLQDIYLSKGIEPELARVISNITNNSQEGIELAKSEDLKNIILLVKKITQAFLSDQNPILVFNEEGKFLTSTNDKNIHQMFLDLLITITNDRLYYILGKKEEIVFLESLEEIDNLGFDVRSFGYNETFKQLQTMLEFKERLNFNVNLELMYYDLFIKCEV